MLGMAMAHTNLGILQKVPDFPNYTDPSFGYPQRCIRKGEDSLQLLGPPLHLYAFHPPKSCTVHVSGIPDWANMSDVVEIFEEFGTIFSIELYVIYSSKELRGAPISKGSAYVTFVSYDGAQKALFAHLNRTIPGMKTPLSIYKGVVNNVVLLKNLPYKTPKSDILDRINNAYSGPGLVDIAFIKDNAARLEFEDMDSALLFMDFVSGGGLIIDNFTCIVEPEDKEQEKEDSEESE